MGNKSSKNIKIKTNKDKVIANLQPISKKELEEIKIKSFKINIVFPEFLIRNEITTNIF